MSEAEPLTQKLVRITIDIDNGKVLTIEGINGAQVTEMPEGELKQTHGQTGAGWDTIAWICWSHSSPGCVRLIGGSLVKIC
jgi:hypothetical protein